MRNISQTSLNKILEREGTDPITLVQIYWAEDKFVIYGDRAFVPEIRGQLLDVGEIQQVINASKGSNSGSVNIRLNDTNGELKLIFDNTDIHKLPVYILQWFTGIPLNDAFIVFDGVISSPIIYKEGERTLSFEVLSKIEDLEVGFSAEEGDFEYIPPNIIGATWPLIFGSVFKLPCLQVNEIPAAFTNRDAGIDGLTQDIKGNERIPETFKTLTEEEQYILEHADALAFQCYTMAAMYAHAEGEYVVSAHLTFEKDSTQVSLRNQSDEWSRAGDFYRNYSQTLADRLSKSNRTAEDKAKIRRLTTNSLEFQTGHNFPQNKLLKITINGAEYTGTFSGNIFNINTRTHPFTDADMISGPTVVVDREFETEYRTQLPTQAFFYSLEGSQAKIGYINGQTDWPIWYIVGCPHLSILAVWGKKSTSDVKIPIPQSYYTIEFKTFGTLKVTLIKLYGPLSARIGEDWTDDIWVNCKSSLGPNPVDIIKYLIAHYTNQSYDTESFNEVHSLVNIYQANFAIKERTSAFQIIQDIAYQSRCAIWFKGGRFYIKYLPKKYDPVDTITESDIESGTLEISPSDTEDVITKWNVQWRTYLDAPKPNRIVYRYHIKKYGLLTNTYDCYIFNNKKSVEKFALFWLIRKSNTWKKIKFSTFLTKLRLEAFDSVKIQFAYPWVDDLSQEIIGVVESAVYNSDSQRIEMEIWLPIRLGEMIPYDFAYPMNLDRTYIFPRQNDPHTKTGIPGAQEHYDDNKIYSQQGEVNGDGTGFKLTDANSGSGGNIAIGDPNDVSDKFDPPTQLDPNDITHIGQPSLNNQFIQATLKSKPVPDEIIKNATFPGIVKSKIDANNYSVDVYFNGLDSVPTNVTVKQLQIHPDDEIPPTTLTMVTRTAKYKVISGLNIQVAEYIMQVPVWLKPKTSNP